MTLLILITAAFAQEPETTKTTVIDFEEVELKGKINKPTALLIQSERKPAVFSPLMPSPKNFSTNRDEILVNQVK